MLIQLVHGPRPFEYVVVGSDPVPVVFLCCPLNAEALRRDDLLSEEMYPTKLKTIVYIVN
jgi:hypothetical protein